MIIDDSNNITGINNITSNQFSSGQYYDNTGHSGLFMNPGAGGNIQITKTFAQGTADAITKFNTNGTIEKSATTVSTAGAITCADNLNLNNKNIANANDINSVNNIVSGQNQSAKYYDTTGVKGIDITTTTGVVKLNSTNYTGVVDGITKFNTDGTIERSNATCSTAGDIVCNSISTGAGDLSVKSTGVSTDNAIPRYDSTTGKLVQNSGVIIDDSNNITGVNSITSTTQELLSGKGALNNLIANASVGGAITTGNKNVIIGNTAGTSLDTGIGNVLIGDSAGLNLASSVSSVCVGTFAGSGITTGHSNTSIGNNSRVGTTGTRNTSLGASSGSLVLTGDYNINIGDGSGSAQTSGANCVNVGTSAGKDNTTGTSNVNI